MAIELNRYYRLGGSHILPFHFLISDLLSNLHKEGWGLALLFISRKKQSKIYRRYSNRVHLTVTVPGASIYIYFNSYKHVDIIRWT